jgi:hypothetical protein
MNSTNGVPTDTSVEWRGLVRTKETGSRRSRTLKDDEGTAQVQAKLADVDGGEQSRYLQIRYWTEESGWTHQVIDPSYPGLAGVIAVGYGETETESWQVARQQVLDAYGVEL